MYELHVLTSNWWFSIGCQTRIPIGSYSLLPNPELSVAGVLLYCPPYWMEPNSSITPRTFYLLGMIIKMLYTVNMSNSYIFYRYNCKFKLEGTILTCLYFFTLQAPEIGSSNLFWGFSHAFPYFPTLTHIFPHFALILLYRPLKLNPPNYSKNCPTLSHIFPRLPISSHANQYLPTLCHDLFSALQAPETWSSNIFWG